MTKKEQIARIIQDVLEEKYCVIDTVVTESTEAYGIWQKFKALTAAVTDATEPLMKEENIHTLSSWVIDHQGYLDDMLETNYKNAEYKARKLLLGDCPALCAEKILKNNP